MKKVAGLVRPLLLPACQQSVPNNLDDGDTVMKFHLETAKVFIPDDLPADKALDRTTHLAIAAHQDDIEIMAAAPILDCFQKLDRWFTGVVVTDGRGSPRDGLYKDYCDEEMRLVRFKEQFKAAVVGEYAAQVMLDYPSSTIKDKDELTPVADLVKILRASSPEVVYTHNLADKHDTHVAVALRAIQAIRSLPEIERPVKLFGCEVWRDLDWLPDEDKIPFDLSSHESLQAALLGVFDSQIAGGKRYDLATMGRRKANATYFQSHGVDTHLGITYGMDLTPLIQDPNVAVEGYIQSFIQRFLSDVTDRLKRLE
jgi:LmbE family N-acetylglucosaminyl deacetylase